MLLKYYRKIVAEQQSSRLDEVKASSNTDDSSSPSQDRGAEGRERQRLREQERRRREAVSCYLFSIHNFKMFNWVNHYLNNHLHSDFIIPKF